LRTPGYCLAAASRLGFSILTTGGFAVRFFHAFLGFAEAKKAIGNGDLCLGIFGNGALYNGMMNLYDLERI
jgi:hypothetical protein